MDDTLECSVCGAPLKSEVAIRRRKCRKCFVSEILGTEANVERSDDAEQDEGAETREAVSPVGVAGDEAEADTSEIEPVDLGPDGKMVVRPKREEAEESADVAPGRRAQADAVRTQRAGRSDSSMQNEVLKELRRIKLRMPESMAQIRGVVRMTPGQQIWLGLRVGLGLFLAALLIAFAVALIVAGLVAFGLIEAAPVSNFFQFVHDSLGLGRP